MLSLGLQEDVGNCRYHGLHPVHGLHDLEVEKLEKSLDPLGVSHSQLFLLLDVYIWSNMFQCFGYFYFEF